MELLDEWLSDRPPGSTLVLLSEDEADAGLSFRNLRRVDVMPVGDAGVADVIGRRVAARVRGRAARISWRAPAAGAGSTRRRPLMDASQVIIRPVVSEKSFVLAEAGKYTFRVHDKAHKTQIRQAVEQLFDVKVVEVRTASVKSKPKRRGQTAGRTRQWKKAIVQVREGDSIPIFQAFEAPE